MPLRRWPARRGSARGRRRWRSGAAEGRSGWITPLDNTSCAVSAGQRSTRSVISRADAASAIWKSSTMITDPVGSFMASFAIEAMTSADMTLFIASTSAASVPNPGVTTLIASMEPAQKRTGSASAPSQDSQDVTSGALTSDQLDSSTLLPAPADPTTTVRRLPAPSVSRSCGADLVTRVPGSVIGRNFVGANRASQGHRAPSSWSVPRHVPWVAPRSQSGRIGRYMRCRPQGRTPPARRNRYRRLRPPGQLNRHGDPLLPATRLSVRCGFPFI